MPVFIDHSGRMASTNSLRRRGAIAAIVLVVIAAVLIGYAKGDFRDSFVIRVNADTVGDGLRAGSDVKFRGFAVGRVESVETKEFGRQRIEIAIDPAQARRMPAAMKAGFGSSNVFGSTSVELEPTQIGGAALRRGATLTIGADDRDVTVSTVFRRTAELTRVLDSEQAQHLEDVFADTALRLGPTFKPYFDLLQVLTDNEKTPLAQRLSRFADLGKGLESITRPTVDLVLGVLNSSTYFGDPANRTRTDKALYGLGDKFLGPIGDLLRKDNPGLAKVIAVTLDLAVPVVSVLGQVAPTYNRISPTLDHIASAFRGTGSNVQLQLDVIVKTMPNLAPAVDRYLERGAQT